MGSLVECKKHLRELQQEYPQDVTKEDIATIVNTLTAKLDSLPVKTEEDTLIAKFEEELDQDQSNNSKRYELVQELVKLERYEDAIKHCLDVLKIDRNWKQGEPLELLFTLFQRLGTTSDIVITAREQLSAILYL